MIVEFFWRAKKRPQQAKGGSLLNLVERLSIDVVHLPSKYLPAFAQLITIRELRDMIFQSSQVKHIDFGAT